MVLAGGADERIKECNGIMNGGRSRGRNLLALGGSNWDSSHFGLLFFWKIYVYLKIYIYHMI